jgi:hypothetical protein
MKVYLVWQHEQYASSWLMGIYADKQQAQDRSDAYEDPETPDIWYAVEEKEVT